jgi:hypothetical protein
MQADLLYSTFVDILANKRKRGTVAGLVSFPIAESGQSDQPLIAFVDQDDVLPPMSS